MAVMNEQNEDLVREMYARFGLAYYYSEVLHRGLCIILALSGISDSNLMTRPRIEEHLARAFSLTLGGVIAELRGKVPTEFMDRLKDILEKRNFLAHHFWFERAHLMFTATHLQQLIHELDSYTLVFNQLDEETKQFFENIRNNLGITEQDLDDSLSRVLSGNAEIPLPNKETMKARDGKLRNPQHLVHVWEFERQDGGKPLVFEMQDGTLWQLCDVGLGWTNFDHVEPNWWEQPIIQPHLPAEINLRPQDAHPWDYEFTLKDDVVLWVKPGRRPKTFRWGLRNVGERIASSQHIEEHKAGLVGNDHLS